MTVTETDRLVLRYLTADDAAFVLALLNDPDWLRYIGDRKVYTLDDARAYIQKGPVDMYERLGHGLYLVERKSDGAPIGLCGLIKRDSLDDIDLGYALAPAYRGAGYASEAAAAALAYAWETVGATRVAAIVSPDNEASTRVLGGLGFTFERPIRFDEDEVHLYTVDA